MHTNMKHLKTCTQIWNIFHRKDKKWFLCFFCTDRMRKGTMIVNLCVCMWFERWGINKERKEESETEVCWRFRYDIRERYIDVFQWSRSDGSRVKWRRVVAVLSLRSKVSDNCGGGLCFRRFVDQKMYRFIWAKKHKNLWKNNQTCEIKKQKGRKIKI